MSNTRFHSHRASLLLTCSTKSNSPIAVDETTTMLMDDLVPYSCVAGHPEATPSTLNAIYGSIYGNTKCAETPFSQPLRGGGTDFFPPPHAYIPPYGGGASIRHPHHRAQAPSPSSPQHQQQKGHMGISELLPLAGGFVASISPAAVRVHSYGGLQVHDLNLEGMLCGTVHPYSGGVGGSLMGPTHISVAGICVPDSTGSSSDRKYQSDNSMYCLDLWQGLRTVYSRSFHDGDGEKVGITTMQTNFEKGSMVCGSTDGKLRILDSSLREVATVRSHQGGVSSMAVSPDGTLIATTGFSSKPSTKGNSQPSSSSVLFTYPDPTVLLYDIRYLGRGGISHPFAGVKGAPRHVRFVTNVEGCASNRFLVASGKPGGGIQIVTPFEAQNEETTSFILPPLEQGEFMTAISDDSEEEAIALGTSYGRILRYRMAHRRSVDFVQTKHASSVLEAEQTLSVSDATVQSNSERKENKTVLPVALFGPELPARSMDPSLLQGDPSLRSGATERTRTIFGAYVMQADPTVTRIGNSVEESMNTFGVIAGDPILVERRRTVSSSLLKEATIGENDYMLTIPTQKLEVNLMENQKIISLRYKGKKLKEPIPNPNKLIYDDKLASMCYEEWKTKPASSLKDTLSSGDFNRRVPARYQLPLRSGYNASGARDPSDYNDTGLFPGWDYGTNMPNEWASPVLLLFYFIPEIRSSVLSAQFSLKTIGTKAYEKALTPELGFVFHQMESLSRYGLLYPSRHKAPSKMQPFRPKIGAWVPSNFLTALATMPEAEHLQVLDGSPAAIERPRRPESFFRFLAYQLDKELPLLSISSSSTKAKSSKSMSMVMDSLSGFNFLSSNQFIESKSSPPTSTVTRALTLDLNYDLFPPGTEKRTIRFGKLLQHSLCRETRLRAWNDQSHDYETIIQRKIATSLPQILTLSCACAGRKHEDGLWAWRSDCGDEPWLPEIVEVELEADGNVTVSEWQEGKNRSDKAVFQGKSTLPPEVSKVISEASTRQKCRYRLEAVLSFVLDQEGGDTENDGNSGHHVLHVRVPLDYRLRLLKNQVEEARKVSMTHDKAYSSTSDDCSSEAKDYVLSASVTAADYEARAALIENELSSIQREIKEEKDIQESGWVLFNGYKVANSIVEDARAFHVSFKEPVLVVFRSVDEMGMPSQANDACSSADTAETRLPPAVLIPRPLSTQSNTGGMSPNVIRRLNAGRLLAFDAEFVSVQEEQWALTESGQKNVLRETRHALGRISVFDCSSNEVIVDDHVLPRERVVDFLTRFSGIVSEDLDPIRSMKNLISTRSAYLQLRYLVEQGCIFVGHGLKQDFYTVNLVVPPHQIVDTVEIFHIPGMRNISLRFLANYVLGRDIQEDIHNSVEDAKAAYDLYQKAVKWKSEGVWEERLRKLYVSGEQSSWKLGIDNGKLEGNEALSDEL